MPLTFTLTEGVLPKGQGVLVVQVTPDTPAAKAGLRPRDILVNYDDQKLYSPEQLIKLGLKELAK